jgi:DNA (cytosine-5)-methyltransferase 1
MTPVQLPTSGSSLPFFDAAPVGPDRHSHFEGPIPLYIQELFVDLFAGGGGASEGIEQAIERRVDIAVNHDPLALALHQANHPETLHYVSDVFEVDPVTACGGYPVGGLWASFDCKHFSKAKGGKPVDKKIRSLAWVVVKWAKGVRPRVIFAENVEEFQTWGPLLRNNQPCPKRKGQTYRRWIRELEALGYAIEWRELRGCDYGAGRRPSASTGASHAPASSSARSRWLRPLSAGSPRG